MKNDQVRSAAARESGPQRDRHSFRNHVLAVLGSMFLFMLSILVNELLFRQTKFVPGAHWIFLPAGMRLLCTLLFGAPGAIGILLATWIGGFLYYFPNDPNRWIVGGLISALAPYLTYLFAKHTLGLRTSLINLTARRLLVLIVLYSVASPALIEAWLALKGDVAGMGMRFLVMVVGDLSGTLILIYAMKLGLWIVALARSSMDRGSR
jgi:hypothetical protein